MLNFEYFKKAGTDLVEEYGLTNASRIADGILCLPLYPGLEVSTVNYIASLIEKNHKLNF